MKKISLLLICLGIVGVLWLLDFSPIKSIFDGTHLIWSSDQDVDNSLTPKGFSVSVKEVQSLIDPLQKRNWYIYADSNSYFIVRSQIPIPGFHINSSFARRYGVKIDGKSRGTYLYVIKVLGSKKYCDFEELSEIIKRKT